MMAIPKRHVESLDELTEAEDRDVSKLIHLAIRALKRLGYTNSTVMVRNGDHSMKSIEHVHTHIVPVAKIGPLDAPRGERHIMTEEEIESTLADIKGARSSS